MRKTILIIMKEGELIGELGSLLGSVAECRHNRIKETVFIRQLSGKSEEIKCKDILLLGTYFGKHCLPIVDNTGDQMDFKSNNDEMEDNDDA